MLSHSLPACALCAAARKDIAMRAPEFVLEHDFLEFEPMLLECFPNRKYFRPKELILNLFSERSRYYYYVISGMAAYTLRHIDGRNKLSTYRGEGTIFPLYFSFRRTNMDSFLEVTAVTDTELLVIPRDDIENLIQKNKGFATAMIDAYAKYTTLLNYEVAMQVFESVRVRICSFIYISCFRNGNSSPVLHITHEDLALAAGVTRANASRVIGDLRSEGIISTERNSICVLDQERLLQASSAILFAAEDAD